MSNKFKNAGRAVGRAVELLLGAMGVPTDCIVFTVSGAFLLWWAFRE